MTSEAPDAAFVWVWLPGATVPVVAGRLEDHDGVVWFNYGRSYLARPDAVALSPDLVLQPGRVAPPAPSTLHGCFVDVAPGAWGRRAVLSRTGHEVGFSALGPLLGATSDRAGAIDVTTSADRWEPRPAAVRLEELASAVAVLEVGESVPEELFTAALAATAFGGAAPKGLVWRQGREVLAKFDPTGSPYPVVAGEAVAMALARRCGIAVPATELVAVDGRDVLLVERFDRGAAPGERRLVCSVATVLGFGDQGAARASYHDLADVVAASFTEPAATLRELFRRVCFNVCVSNTDDHARNHAAYWDGAMFSLAPAYDICPQPRGPLPTHAMAFAPGRYRSRLVDCVEAASVFGLSRKEALGVIDELVGVIMDSFAAASDAAGVSTLERCHMWERHFLAPDIFEGYPASVGSPVLRPA